MQQRAFKYILVPLIVLLTNQLYATAQYGDILIVKGDTSWIFSNPLENYFKKKGSRTIGDTALKGNCTALWRGYVATWLLENDSLFLVRLQTNYCGDNPVEVGLFEEFQTNKVFADWTSSTLVRPEGELLNYVHAGYMSIYEGDTYHFIEDGLLTETKTYNYLEREQGRTFPGEDFLKDTIRTMILKSIPMKERETFYEGHNCSMTIVFTEQGEIDTIEVYYGKKPETIMQKTIRLRAKEVLKDFPKLMKVEHDRYHPPSVELWFSGHCLKYPLDREYGCNYE